MEKGKFYLIPTTISEAVIDSLSAKAIAALARCKHFVVERARTSRRFIKLCHPSADISKLHFYELEEKDGTKLNFNQIEDLLSKGMDVGLMSEAGCPAIADPGTELIRYLQAKNYAIVPLAGPSSINLALMASGLNGQNFSFHGYLPIEKSDLIKTIKQLDRNVQKDKATRIFIETPYRNDRLLKFLLDNLDKDTLLCVASDITGKEEQILTKRVSNWKSADHSIGKLPTVFLIGK